MANKNKGHVADVTDSGLSAQQCKKVADALSKMLADTYGLYLKTQNFHWNIVGPDFYALHKFLEAQYEELADAVDEIAERIRILGHRAPGSFKAFSSMMTIKENDEKIPAEEMLRELVADHEALAKRAREYYDVADGFDDQGSADLLAGRMNAHEKAGWMIGAHLEK